MTQNNQNPSQDYIDFMIGKNRNSSSSSQKQHSSSIEDIQQEDSSQQHNSNNSKQSNHHYHNLRRQICKSFYRIIYNDFLLPDDTAEHVIDSIYNLRHIIYSTSQFILSIQNKKREYHMNNTNNNEELNDLYLTLNDNLLRHERMLISLRQLISCMGQAIEALGRQLNRYYDYSETTITISTKASTVTTTTLPSDNDDNDDDYNDNNINADDNVIFHHHEWLPKANDEEVSVSSLTFLYINLSKELYRKQVLVNDIMNTCTDGLLYHDDDDGDNNDDDNDANMKRNLITSQMNYNNEMDMIVMERMMTKMMLTKSDAVSTTNKIKKRQQQLEWSRHNNPRSYLYESNELLNELYNTSTQNH